MSYTHSPETDEGRLRILLYDVVPSGTSAAIGSNYHFEDADLSALLDMNSDDLWASAADGCRAMAAKLADEAIALGLGKTDIYVDKRKKPDFYLKLAAEYQERSYTDVDEYIDSINYGVSYTGFDDTEYFGDYE